MASTALSTGVQQIYKAGLLHSSLTSASLAQATAGQISTLAAGNVALQQISSLFGTGATNAPQTDTAYLSSDGYDALLQQINPPTAANASSSTDPFTQAVYNALITSGGRFNLLA